MVLIFCRNIIKEKKKIFLALPTQTSIQNHKEVLLNCNHKLLPTYFVGDWVGLVEG